MATTFGRIPFSELIVTTCCLGSGCLSRPRSSQFPFGLSVTSMEWYVSKVSNESLHSAHQGQTVDAVRVLGGVCHLNPCYIPWNRGQSAPPFVPNGQSPACRTFILPDTSSLQLLHPDHLHRVALYSSHPDTSRSNSVGSTPMELLPPIRPRLGSSLPSTLLCRAAAEHTAVYISH